MRYKVVIADDEQLILRNLTQIIDWQSLECELVGTAHNGQGVLEIMKNHQVDILLTDISMPGITGIELLRRINTIEHKTMVILISGYNDFEFAKEAIKNNALDYILKPIDYDELEECIERAIKGLNEQKISEYEHKKYLIYELITTGIIDSQVINMQNPYFSIVVRSHIKDIEAIIQKKHRSLFDGDSNLYLYKLSNQEIALVVELLNSPIDDAKTIGDKFARNIVDDVSDKCVLAIGKVVMCLFDIKKSFDHAKELIKYETYINGNVITEEWLKEEYKPSQSAADLIEDALKYIQNNFQADLGMEQLAQQIGLSVSYFSLLFKQRTGSTFLDYLTNIRIEYACHFLQNSDLKTYEIAQKVGYTDQRYFSQVFKKRMKKTPSEYRRIVNGK